MRHKFMTVFKSVFRFKIFAKTLDNCRRFSLTSKMSYSIVEKGTLYTPDYRVFFKNDKGHFISPLHDIPLFADAEKKVYNMVVEIPRWTNAKMEINLKEVLNPIKQDIKKDKPRFVPNCFPHKGYIWNYGALPQTWENPNVVDENTKCKGDNDPIDCLEIGSKVANRGEILQVKILGTVALIDEGETDWKVITINVNDPVAKDLNNITDVEKTFPGLLRATVEWFKIYKIPDGKPENQFAFGGEPKPAEFATKIVQETHEEWKKLISKQVDGNGICVSSTTLEEATSSLTPSEAEALVDKFPCVNKNCTTDGQVDKWHFVSLKF